MKTIGHDKSGREIVKINGKFYRKNPASSHLYDVRIPGQSAWVTGVSKKEALRQYHYLRSQGNALVDILDENNKDVTTELVDKELMTNPAPVSTVEWKEDHKVILFDDEVEEFSSKLPNPLELKITKCQKKE